jgi:hypothetical protein
MRAAIILALTVTWGTGAVATQDPKGDPLEFYKGYLSVLSKATSLDQLLPYYSKELAQGLSKMPKEMQGNYIKMNARQLSDLKVIKQSVTASKADYEFTAKTSKGIETRGAATLIREGGAWKVEDEQWATPTP